MAAVASPALSIPRIQDRNADAFKILHVACNQGQAVLKSRCRNLGVGNMQRTAHDLPLPFQSTPPLCNSLTHRHNAPREPRWNQSIDCSLQLTSPRSGGHDRKALSHLPKGHHTLRQAFLQDVLAPCDNLGLWDRPQNLGNDVRVNQKIAHSKSTGRLADVVLLK